MLDRRTKTTALALELRTRVALQARVGKRRGESDHDDYDQHFGQGESSEMTGRKDAPDTRLARKR